MTAVHFQPPTDLLDAVEGRCIDLRSLLDPCSTLRILESNYRIVYSVAIEQFARNWPIRRTFPPFFSTRALLPDPLAVPEALRRLATRHKAASPGPIDHTLVTGSVCVPPRGLCPCPTISSCDDFINETGQLAFIAEKLGVDIDFSPKCHPELAGEGIEYSWGFAKRMYRREWLWQDDKDRKRKDFFDLVRKVLSGKDNGALNKERIRRMGGRARGYIVAYLMIEEWCWVKSSSGRDGGSGGDKKGLFIFDFLQYDREDGQEL